MLFDKITPEQAGISSRAVAELIDTLERHGCTTHALLMMKGDALFAEDYWAPFDRDFCHRMYSQTKSYVGVAIGLLEEEGKVDLDRTILSYFPEKSEGTPKRYLPALTVREMLTMTTGGGPGNWFTASDPDRTHYYINDAGGSRPSGTLWEYDSAGSQVLGALVEKLSGKSLFAYLKEKVFDALGTFRTAEILKTKTDDSWGDSALVCTPRDMISFARFVMNYGTWYGRRLMNERYLRLATSRVVDNCENGFRDCFSHGYGYQIWRTEMNGFAFNGMGCQFTICVPEKDLIFVITSDNQGYAAARDIIVNGFFDLIARKIADAPLPADPEAEAELAEATSGLKLRAVSGMTDSPLKDTLNGRTYVCSANPMGITRFTFVFNGDRGELRYTNAQGDKVLPFGIGYNVFGKFPQLGYSDGHGGLRTTDGFTYKDAVSLAFRDANKIMMRVQIIDRYFGNATFIFAFKGDEAVVAMTKTAEDFLGEYQGRALARAEE